MTVQATVKKVLKSFEVGKSHWVNTITQLFYAWMTNLMVQASWQSDMEFSSLEVVVLSAVQDTVVGGAGCFVCAQCHA